MPSTDRDAPRPGSADALSETADDIGARAEAPTAAEALQLLERGNERWRRLESRHPHEDLTWRRSLLSGQHPFAIILSCADSRVAPELVFDAGLGDLFTVRSAGQVLDASVLGSIVFGVRHLGIPLVVVLGHSSCGAVTAALETRASGEAPPGHVGSLVEHILPALDALPGGEEDPLDAAVRANALHIARLLREDGELGESIAAGAVEVVAARYDLDSSRVDYLG